MRILLLTAAGDGRGDVASVLPSLQLLDHQIRLAPHDVAALLAPPQPDVVLVDARTDLISARGTCRVLRATGLRARLLAILNEPGLAGLSADWGIDDFVLADAGPAEVSARLQLAGVAVVSESEQTLRAGDLVIEPSKYTARIRGRLLDLTYKEFELLRFLAEYPGRVFTREQLLHEVWGYDYFGGTRTVDVHVRRLRAKLGNEHESMIGTVRHVGYKLTLPPPRELPDGELASV